MAFLSPLLAPTLRTSKKSLTGTSVHTSSPRSPPLFPCTPIHYRRHPTLVAQSSEPDQNNNPLNHSKKNSSSSSPPPPPAIIRRVDINSTADSTCLQAIYSIWNSIASSEGIPPLSPDERDAAKSTIHLLAEIPQQQIDASSSSSKVVGAARLLSEGPNNIRLDRVCVLPDFRLRGIGRMLVNEMLSLAGDTNGAIYVDAIPGHDMGFFSILGFEPVGNDRFDDTLHTIVRTMLLTVPECSPPVTGGCVGLHHASLRVSDIERSLAFYGSVGFIVDDKFMTSSGARACFVQGLGTRLELVECPINGNAGSMAGVQAPAGFDRLVFDVTKACTDLDVYLQHLARRNGGHLDIAGPPAKQVIGNSVVASASITDPDGMPIEFIRREAQVPGELRTRVKW